MSFCKIKIFCLGLLLSAGASALVEQKLPNMADQPPTLYTGFGQLLDDDKTLVLEELMDLDKDIQRIALYHNGDRLHRLVPKQVHFMIENKLMGRLINSGRFDVIQCIECRTTKVEMSNDELTIAQAAGSNQQLRSLSKEVRAHAFMFWNASVHEDKYTINLRLVDGRNNELLWLKEYSKKTTSEIEDELDEVSYEVILGAWGAGGERKDASGKTAELEGATVIGLRRRISSSFDDDTEYTLGIEYFKNYSSTDVFDLSGFNLEGRIITPLPSLDELVDTSMYLGLGQSFFNDSNSLIFRFGFEFPFFNDGFMDFGVMYMDENTVTWGKKTGYETKGKYGGASYDLTLGIRF